MRPALLVGFLTAALLATAGCGSTCDNLEEVCAKCADPALKVSCDASVAVGEEKFCSEDIDTYEGLGCQ